MSCGIPTLTLSLKKADVILCRPQTSDTSQLQLFLKINIFSYTVAGLAVEYFPQKDGILTWKIFVSFNEVAFSLGTDCRALIGLYAFLGYNSIYNK